MNPRTSLVKSSTHEISASCAAYEQTTDLHASCELVLPNCPRTVYEYLGTDGELLPREILEGDGLEEVGNPPVHAGGTRFSFTKEDGILAGWWTWNDSPLGPCREFSPRRGRLLITEDPTSTHRCGLAEDARETGVLCDCPCPDPPPSDGIQEGSVACLNAGWRACAETFAEQRVYAAVHNAPMRSGCGLRFDGLPSGIRSRQVRTARKG